MDELIPIFHSVSSRLDSRHILLDECLLRHLLLTRQTQGKLRPFWWLEAHRPLLLPQMDQALPLYAALSAFLLEILASLRRIRSYILHAADDN